MDGVNESGWPVAVPATLSARGEESGSDWPAVIIIQLRAVGRGAEQRCQCSD